ncbi:MAG: PAS domain S-box protein [Desulfobacterales bacterium]|nr:PAS domain S-box protein [Desulfobacterales bacterium]
MSSLLQDHLMEITLREKSASEQDTCWRVFSCARVLCPAHGKKITECWLVPKTHCAGDIREDFFHRLSSCLACSYFKLRGEAHPGGWNVFIADQLHRYNVKALERLYQKEESFVEILNRIPDGLFTTDHEWRITYFNPAAEKITGFSAYDAVGMYCKDVFKNSICEYDCALKRAVVEQRDIHNREYEITNIDGEKVPIICSTSAFHDANGKISGGLEIFKDITELKRLQEELARRERKYRRIFEGSHDMIYTSTLDGSLLDVNQAGVEMLGYSDKEELLGLGSAERLYRNSRDRGKFLKLINKHGYIKDFEVDFAKSDHSPIRVLISSRRYENPGTGEVEYEGIIKDITRRVQTEELINQRNRELSIINSIAVALNHTMDLNRILKSTLEKIIKVLRLSRGGLFLIDRAGKTVQVKARYGLPEEKQGKRDEVVFKDALLMEHLIQKDASLAPRPSFPSFQAGLFAAGERTEFSLTCFLITFKGRGVGFFGLDIPPDRVLSRHETHLLGSLGNFLGGVIENTRMMGTIRRHRQDLRRLTEKLFQSQEDERRRIARELHDEAGQSLTAVKLGLDRLEEKHAGDDGPIKEEIGEIRKLISRTASEIRRLSFNLHPTLLIDLGLEPALNLYFSEIRLNSGLDIEFNMVGFDHRLSMDMETVLYRFSQETLTNALKHSGAETFSLSIIKSYPNIIFLAEDDGMGFDAETMKTDKRSLGLLGMRERAALFGGAFHLRATPGEGTRIRIEIPLPEELNHE